MKHNNDDDNNNNKNNSNNNYNNNNNNNNNLQRTNHKITFIFSNCNLSGSSVILTIS